jgi:hypothetical protein
MRVRLAAREVARARGLRHRSPDLAPAVRGKPPGPDPLLRCWPRALVLQILERKRVAALEHLNARAALLGDRLAIFAGADAQRDQDPAIKLRDDEGPAVSQPVRDVGDGARPGFRR